MDAHKNFAYSTVATAPSPATSGTTLTVATGEGANFPAAPFNVTVWPVGTRPTNANAEILRVTNKGTGDNWTITRTQESTSARTIVVGDQIAATITSLTLTDAETAGRTMVGDLLFTDATYDIGKSGATRPRDGFFSRNCAIGGTLSVTGTLSPLGLLDISGASAGQVKFPATANPSADANTLDDYEEGTWTPTLTGVSGGTAALTNKNGYYVKIGRVVYIQFDISGTDGASLTGYWKLGGLPFTSNNDASGNSYKGVFTLDHYRLFPTSANSTGIVAAVVKNSTFCQFLFSYGGAANTETAAISDGAPSVSLEVSGAGFYFI